ncbi:MAG TPA: DNA repair protein RecO [Burkholderiales bacterium]|nr:DNA repair protein RecO [Betaproteobacteria bacterium]HQR53870.1 DNA repair protein RecO [Burkholderiales bacterium]
MSARETGRRDGEPAFILHRYPWKETSLVLEAFSRQWGRVALVARGARRPASALRSALRAFEPLELSWFGRSELRTLHAAERVGGFPFLRGTALMCGFYLNELILRLVPRDDPHERLYLAYETTLRRLGEGTAAEPALRGFEKYLLQELGYAMPLAVEAGSGAPIEAGERYHYEIERGPVRAAADTAENRLELRGKTLLDLVADDYSDPHTLQQSKLLMRTLISHYLGDRPLYSRQLLRDLQQL